MAGHSVVSGSKSNRKILSAVNVAMMMLFSAGRAPAHTQNPLITTMARHYNTVTGQSCKPPGRVTVTRRPTSCRVTATLHFTVKAKRQKGVSRPFCSPPVRGDVWTSVPLSKAAHNLPLPATSGLLRAVSDGGSGQSNRRRLCPH